MFNAAEQGGWLQDTAGNTLAELLLCSVPAGHGIQQTPALVDQGLFYLAALLDSLLEKCLFLAQLV